MPQSCAAALFLLIAPLQNSEPSRLATVTPVALPVYTQTSVHSALVKTLHQGDRVVVEFEIVTGQAWCRIRETDQAKSSGYALCGQLDRSAQSPQPRWGPVSPQSPSTAPATVSLGAWAFMPGLEFWAARFKLRDEQRQQSAGLLQRSGLTACREWWTSA